MLTPQEVSEHVFSKASFGGYNMAMVDEFLDILTVDYTTLYKENATLKAKMKVLVDKVEEYRSTEDAMCKALLTAQKMADDLVAEAEQKRNRLMQTAEEDAKARKEELTQSVRDEELRLAAARSATADYVSKLKELYRHEMEYLDSLSTLTAPPPADPVGDAVRDIEQSVEKQLQEDVPEEAVSQAGSAPEEQAVQEGGLYAELMELNQEEATAEDQEDEVEEPTRRIDFSNLQFGKDYEIK